jgi:hypothetical protein
MQRLQLINQADTSDEVNILGDRILDYSPDREHTAVGTFAVAVAPADGRIKQRLGDKARIYELRDDGTWELLFNGELLAADVNDTEATATLKGEGIGRHLKRSSNSVVYEDVKYWEAIDDYVNEFLPDWDWTVYPPDPVPLRSGTVLTSIPNETSFDSFFGSDIPEPWSTNISGGEGLKLLQSALLFSTDAREVEASGGVFTRSSTATAAGASDNLDYEFGGQGTDIPAVLKFEDGLGYDLDPDAYDGLDKAPLDFHIRHRFEREDFQGKIEYRVDGRVVGTFDTSEGDDPSNYSTYTWYNATETRLDFLAFGPHTFEVAMVENNTTDADGNPDDDSNVYNVDAVAPLDNRYGPYTFSSTLEGGSLKGPELYPAEYPFQIEDTGLGSNLTEVTIDSTLENSEFGVNGKYRVRTSETASYTDFTQETFTTDLSNQAGNRLDVKLVLSRYTTDTSTSPTQGDTGTKLTFYESKISTNDVPVISGRKEFSGTNLDILTQLHEEGRMRFSILHDSPGKPYRAESFKKGDIVKDVEWRVLSKQTGEDIFDYWNSVEVFGRRRKGGRLSVTEKAPAEINNSGYGERKNSNIYPRIIDDESQLRTEAVRFLLKGVDGDVTKADLTIAAKNIPPGYSYKIQMGGG